MLRCYIVTVLFKCSDCINLPFFSVLYGFLFVGQKISLVRDVSYEKRKVWNSSFPKHIKRIHFVGAPLSKQIHKRIKSNYCAIKKFGPNDGITQLADEITDGGIIVS